MTSAGEAPAWRRARAPAWHKPTPWPNPRPEKVKVAPVAADVETRAADRARTEGATERLPKRVAAHDRRRRPQRCRPATTSNRHLHGASGIIAARDLDRVDAAWLHGRPRIDASAGKRGREVGERDVVLPSACTFCGDAVVGTRDEVRAIGAAPHGRRGARVAAAVGVKERLGGLAIEHQDDAGGLRRPLVTRPPPSVDVCSRRGSNS